MVVLLLVSPILTELLYLFIYFCSQIGYIKIITNRNDIPSFLENFGMFHQTFSVFEKGKSHLVIN